MEIMRSKIIKEMTAVRDLQNWRIEEHNRKKNSQRVNIGKLVKPKFDRLAIDHLDPDTPANKLGVFEQFFGLFPKVSSTERIFND